MGKNTEVRGWELSEIINFALRDRRNEDLERSDRAERWFFESLLHFNAAEIPRYQIRLGAGSWQKEQHGSFPLSSGPVSAKTSLVPYVESSWRGVYCRYWDDKEFRELRIKISGQVSWLSSRGERGSFWQEALLVQSWYTLQYPQIKVLVWGYLPDDRTLVLKAK